MLKLKTSLTTLALAAVTLAALPKNGGLTDERPKYDSPSAAKYVPVEPKLRSLWWDNVTSNTDSVWAEYPRPLLRRDTWENLNGIWEFQFAKSKDEVANPPVKTTLEQRILVPYCIESGLSGIALQSESFYSWWVISLVYRMCRISHFHPKVPYVLHGAQVV